MLGHSHAHSACATDAAVVRLEAPGVAGHGVVAREVRRGDGCVEEAWPERKTRPRVDPRCDPPRGGVARLGRFAHEEERGGAAWGSYRSSAAEGHIYT